MFDSYIYPFDGRNVTVSLYDLPAGQYDFYLYGAYGYINEQNGVYSLNSASQYYCGAPAVPSFSGTAVSVHTHMVKYLPVEANGSANINCRNGTIRFWFRPDWSSVSAGGTGPYSWGRLIEVGGWSWDNTYGWWSLYFDPNGNTIYFSSQANGEWTSYCAVPISWTSGNWHQVTLAYSLEGTGLYIDGQQVASGVGIQGYPSFAVRTATGFNVGSDYFACEQARGQFDELETFNYPLSAEDIARSYNAIANLNANALAVGFVSDHVNTRSITAQIEGGPGVSMAILLNSTNFEAATWGLFNEAPAIELTNADGIHEIWFGFRDMNGTTVWTLSRITLDRVPPVITFADSSPATTSWPVIQVKGSCNEQLNEVTFSLVNADGELTDQKVPILDQYYDPQLEDYTTTWFQCFDVALANGNNVFTIRAVDLAGNIALQQITYVLNIAADQTPPAITVFWPQEGLKISGGAFTVRGWVDDPTVQLSARINANGAVSDRSVPVERNGLFFLETVGLTSAGPTLVTLTATDANGNTGSKSVTVNQSAVVLHIDPVDLAVFRNGVADITGTISDPAWSVWVNGVQAAVDAWGFWVAHQVPINYAGSANIQAMAYPPGQAPDPNTAGHYGGTNGSGPGGSGSSGAGSSNPGNSQDPADINNPPPNPYSVDKTINLDHPPRVFVEHYTVSSEGSLTPVSSPDHPERVTFNFTAALGQGGTAVHVTYWPQQAPPPSPEDPGFLIENKYEYNWSAFGNGTVNTTAKILTYNGTTTQSSTEPTGPLFGVAGWPHINSESSTGFECVTMTKDSQGNPIQTQRYKRRPAKAEIKLDTGKGDPIKKDTFVKLYCEVIDLSQNTIPFTATDIDIASLTGKSIPSSKIRLDGVELNADSCVFLKKPKNQNVQLFVYIKDRNYNKDWNKIKSTILPHAKAILTRSYHPGLGASFAKKYLQHKFNDISDFFGRDEDNKYDDSEAFLNPDNPAAYNVKLYLLDDVPAYLEFFITNDLSPTVFPDPYDDPKYLNIRSSLDADSLRDSTWADIKVVESLSWDRKTIKGYSVMVQKPAKFIVDYWAETKVLAHEWGQCVFGPHRDPLFEDKALMNQYYPSGKEINRIERDLVIRDYPAQ
jgi:hypothetical protein